MRDRVERHFAVLRRAVADRGGEVFATMGDGIAAAFPSAEAAIDAAVAGQREMQSVDLCVRMGVHTGEVDRADDDYRGRPVNRAARIMAVAHGGQVLLSDVTAALVRSRLGDLELVDLGTHRLRDLSDPEHLWQLTHHELERSFPAVRGVDSYPNNLPVGRSSLVGRDREVRRVIDELRHHRVVTLTGVGGVGKTRLAVQAAADLLPQFTNVWFVELASVADPDDIADAIAVTLGAGAVADPLAAAVAMLGGEPTLLIVDNCEHLVDSAAQVVDQLLAGCAQLSVIVTSREPLDIDGEQVVPVRPLDPSTTASELFRQRARAAGADRDDLDRALVERVCARLDGIPLAIELAAARAATLGVPAILDALDDRLSVLGGGRRRAVDRHGTMRTTIDWSYRLLGEAERQMFERLAVFPNGIELDAARHIARGIGLDEATADELVVSLAHKSLLFPEVHPPAVRHRMLETVRAFALERLDEHEERVDALAGLADWVTTITDLPYRDCCSDAVERNAIRLEREADTWRDAVVLAARLGSGDLAARLCGPPVAFFLLGRHDLADYVQPLLDACADPLQRRAVLCALLVSSAGTTDAQQVDVWVREIERAEAIEPTGLGGLMRWLALAWQGDFAASVELCWQASLDPQIAPATRDMFVGIAVLDHFSLTDARTDPHGLIERALDVADHSPVALHRTTCWLGAAWGLADTEPDRAVQLVRRALADIDDVPAITRFTLPGSASRLLAHIDPRVAAQGLLEQLDPTPSRRSFVDVIPIFYGIALLQRLGHPAAAHALTTVTASPFAPYLSMMDFVDLARRASSPSNVLGLSEIEDAVRSALTEIVADADVCATT
jgi:predicted ATPase